MVMKVPEIPEPPRYATKTCGIGSAPVMDETFEAYKQHCQIVLLDHECCKTCKLWRGVEFDAGECYGMPASLQHNWGNGAGYRSYYPSGGHMDDKSYHQPQTVAWHWCGRYQPDDSFKERRG